MPPSTAVPSTAPNSYAVSEIADAAPALSAGTLEMITSLEIVSAAPMPSDSSDERQRPAHPPSPAARRAERRRTRPR